MKALAITCNTCLVLMVMTTLCQAQNVGIGTSTPSRELSVNGSIIVDHDTTNYGTLYDPALLFGSSGLTGITSNYNPLDADYHGLNFWTSGYNRMTIGQNGNIGIGLNPHPSYRLDISGSLRATSTIFGSTVSASQYVTGLSGIRGGGGVYSNSYKLQINNGDSYFGGEGTFTGKLLTQGILQTQSNLFVGGNASITGYLATSGLMYANGNLRVFDNMAVGGNVDNNYRLRVYDGNARIGGDFHATGNAAIGGDVDNNLRFRVWGGDSRFGGDVEVTGTMNTTDLAVANNFTINGTGSVRSNGPSPLKISFHQKSVDMYVNQGSMNYTTASIPDFTGGSGEVRVMIAQFEPDPVDGGDYYHWITFHVYEVDDDTDTVSIGIRNHSPWGTDIKGTLYLMVVLKDV